MYVPETGSDGAHNLSKRSCENETYQSFSEATKVVGLFLVSSSAAAKTGSGEGIVLFAPPYPCKMQGR